MVKTIVGSFDSINEAHQVASELRAAGFLDSDISIVANNADGGYENDARLDATARTDAGRDEASATAKGAVAGAVVGGGAGLAASLAGLAIPGIGPIIAAGPIVATLAVADRSGRRRPHRWPGGPGCPRERRRVRRRGGVPRRALVTVRADESPAEEAADIMRDRGAVDIQRVERWREQGWQRFDAGAQPYTPDDIRRDRTTDRPLRARVQRARARCRMSDPENPRPDTGATIAIYDRPPWWKCRRVWALALPGGCLAGLARALRLARVKRPARRPALA